MAHTLEASGELPKPANEMLVTVNRLLQPLTEERSLTATERTAEKLLAEFEQTPKNRRLAMIRELLIVMQVAGAYADEFAANSIDSDLGRPNNNCPECLFENSLVPNGRIGICLACDVCLGKVLH